MKIKNLITLLEKAQTKGAKEVCFWDADVDNYPKYDIIERRPDGSKIGLKDLLTGHKPPILDLAISKDF